VVKPTKIIVNEGPSQLNLAMPTMGKNRFVIIPKLVVINIPNKQY
jgi:hypothetical protein